jgi:hypothetical protein
MKLLHIEARKKFDISKLNLKPLDKFTEVSLASTVQYLDLLPVVEKYLKSKKEHITKDKYWDVIQTHLTKNQKNFFS